MFLADALFSLLGGRHVRTDVIITSFSYCFSGGLGPTWWPYHNVPGIEVGDKFMSVFSLTISDLHNARVIIVYSGFVLSCSLCDLDHHSRLQGIFRIQYGGAGCRETHRQGRLQKTAVIFFVIQRNFEMLFQFRFAATFFFFNLKPLFKWNEDDILSFFMS